MLRWHKFEVQLKGKKWSEFLKWNSRKFKLIKAKKSIKEEKIIKQEIKWLTVSKINDKQPTNKYMQHSLLWYWNNFNFVYGSLFLYLNFWYVCVWIGLPFISMYIYLSIHLSISIYLYLSVSSFWLYICLLVCLSKSHTLTLCLWHFHFPPSLKSH